MRIRDFDPSNGLKIARLIITEELADKILLISNLTYHNQLKIELNDGTTIYISYNKVGEYGYQIMFSSIVLDRVRFDSMDKTWTIETKPHHFHPRFDEKAYESPMNGNPRDDIYLLCEMIKSNELKSRDKRF